jgi:AcrR family transcriptional regulator
MLEVAATQGYASTSIARVIARAGVSRPTFYDYFASREACMLAVIELARDELHNRASEAIAAATARDAFAAVVDALVGFAVEQPAMARVLYGEAMAAGARALDIRDRAVLELATLIEDAYRQLTPATSIPDVPGAIVIGAIFRLLGHRLRRCEPELSKTRPLLLDWIWAYARAKRAHRWRVLSPGKRTIASPHTPRTLHSIGALGDAAGCSRGSSRSTAARERRRRVLLALAELASEKGYAAVSVQDITCNSGVEMRAFYRMFAGKQEAFAALAEVYFQHMMALTAGAFFSDRLWPERVLEAKLALAGCVEANPAVARSCFVEAHAGERNGGERVEQLTRAFTLFLTEGQQFCEGHAGATRLGQDAIAHASFELVYRQARTSASPAMAGIVGHSVHLCLAPFVGVSAAQELIEKAGAPPVAV